MRVLVSVLVCGLALISGCAGVPAAGRARCAAPQAPDAGLAGEIDPILEAARGQGFAGQVALMRGGVVVYRRDIGNADLEGQVAVSEATLFQVASITKYFTAVLVLKAAEEGRFGLDDAVAPLLGAQIGRPDATIMDLLSHRSGLGSSYAAEPARTGEEAVAAIGAIPFDASRAGAFHYSNDGYDLLAVVLERAYGRPYEDIFREKIGAPACLEHFGFWEQTADLADPHIRAQALSPPPPPLRHRSYGMIGSAGLLISAGELARFEQALNAGAILSPDSLAALRTPRAQTSVGQAAFGSFIVDTPAGRAISARGVEDWGDNAYLNDYAGCGYIYAFVTSRGPAENSGRPLFRDSVTPQVERVLRERCRP
jgi:CubicO group peptidase (beta-lactamase class C family)